MGCGASLCKDPKEPTQVYTWHRKWNGGAHFDPPGEYVFNKASSCMGVTLPEGGQLKRMRERAAEAAEAAKGSMDAKAREMAAVRARPSAKQFLAAAESGDAQLVGEMLKQGALIDSKGSGKKTPLLVACEHGHEQVAQVLIRQGADIYTECPETGATPLLLGCAQGCEKIVTELCANRVGLWPKRARCSSPAASQASDGLYTPWSVLCENGHTAIIERLLARGLITNPPDPKEAEHNGGWTRMKWMQAVGEGMALGASMGEVGVIKLCLDNLVQVDARDRKGWTALGRVSCRRLLSIRSDRACRLADTKRVACSQAVQCGHIASVKLLLANGATVDFRLPHGGNAFHVAAQLGREEVGQMVLEEGARSGLPTLMALLTMKDKAGRKPVDLAAEEKHPAFLEMLAAFISPPPPREPAHFAAIKKLAIFFEDVSHRNVGLGCA